MPIPSPLRRPRPPAGLPRIHPIGVVVAAAFGLPMRDLALGQLRDLDRLVHEPARLMVLAYLFVTESADFLLLASQTGLTLGNLSSHVAKLEDAGYVEVEKSFRGKRPHTMLRLTSAGRAAFSRYRDQVTRALAVPSGLD